MIEKVANQRLAFKVYESIPGTRAYMANCYRELVSQSYFKQPTALVTFTLNPHDPQLRHFLQFMRKYRPAELQENDSKMFDLFPQLQFTHFHFNNIIKVVTSDDFWHGYKCTHYSYVIEYHKQSGYPHCHLILWANLPYTLRDIKRHNDNAENWLLRFWDTMLSTNPDQAPQFCRFQYHKCLPQRCYKKFKNSTKCRSGFPQIPLPKYFCKKKRGFIFSFNNL